MSPMPALVLDAGVKLQLLDDVYRGPIYLIGPEGTIVSEVRTRNWLWEGTSVPATAPQPRPI